MKTINTPFGEVEVPENWDQRFDPHLYTCLQARLERFFHQTTGPIKLDLQLEVDACVREMDLVGSKPTPRRKLVEVTEGGRKFMRME